MKSYVEEKGLMEHLTSVSELLNHYSLVKYQTENINKPLHKGSVFVKQIVKLGLT